MIYNNKNGVGAGYRPVGWKRQELETGSLKNYKGIVRWGVT